MKRWFKELKIFLLGDKVKTKSSITQQRGTWSERLIDSRNNWLNAVNAEDDGMLFEAIEFYLKDAIQCLSQVSLEKTALSCSSAANCLRKTGNTIYANRLYLEAAILYEENADYIISESVKASLWSLQEAYEHYILADDSDNAQIVYEKYASLAAKINPLFGLREAIQGLEFRKVTAESVQLATKTFSKAAMQKASMQISLEITKTIEDFIQLRKSTRARTTVTRNNNDLKFENHDQKATTTANELNPATVSASSSDASTVGVIKYSRHEHT